MVFSRAHELKTPHRNWTVKNGTEENPDDFTNPDFTGASQTTKKVEAAPVHKVGIHICPQLFEFGEILWMARKKPSPGMWGVNNWKKMNDCLTQDIQVKLCNVAKLTVRQSYESG